MISTEKLNLEYIRRKVTGVKKIAQDMWKDDKLASSASVLDVGEAEYLLGYIEGLEDRIKKLKSK